MAPVLRPRTFFAALLPACAMLPISAVSLLSGDPYLFPLTHLPRAVVAAQTVLALIFLPILFFRQKEGCRLRALILDSLVAFAVSVPFVVFAAIVASLYLWSVVVSQFLYIAMILFSVSLATRVWRRSGISLFLMTVFILIAAVPLGGEIIGQFRAPLNLSSLSPVVFSIQSVSERKISLPAVACASIFLIIATILWRSIILRRKAEKPL